MVTVGVSADFSASSSNVGQATADLSTPAAKVVPDSQMVTKLRDIAFGKNSDGEYKEPSSRVREAARQALKNIEAAAKSDAEAVARAKAAQNRTPATTSDAPAGVRQTSAEEPRAAARSADDSRGPSRPGYAIISANGEFRRIDFQPPPAAPFQPPTTTPGLGSQPITGLGGQPVTGLTGGAGEATALGGLAFVSPTSGGAEAWAAPSGVATGAMNQGEAKVSGATDTAQALSQGNNVQTVETQRRSSVSFDPHIRGYRWGQIYSQADGAYWTPARLDVDTMLNKIDPGMIGDVVVVPGPYGLRYGPGFAFIDVERVPTPRHECFQADFETNGMVNTNGGQFYGRGTAAGGNSDWGFRMSYGERKGSDYEAGNGQKIPSSYHNRDVWGEISLDVAPHQRVEVAYQRLDQTDTEYPAQFFDLNYLGSYGFQARFIDDDPTAPWSKLTAGTWYNQTWFHGDTSRKNNPTFPVMQRVDWALDQQYLNDYGTLPADPEHLSGLTSGATYSTGARVNVTFGDKDSTHLNVGSDVRYLGQVIGEQYQILGSAGDAFSTNMPHSWMINPGTYAEISHPVTELWTVAVGARMDYVQTTARRSDLRYDANIGGYGGSLPTINDDFTGQLSEDNTLYAFYMTNEWKLGEHWKATGGFGQAQRPTTLVERYADGIFLALLQSGFTHVVGNPALKPERDWQIDLGLSLDYENFRGHLNGYQAYILDYVTFDGGSVIVPTFADARLVQYINTRYATLTGFDAYGEYDLSTHLTCFGKVSYVQGEDQEINRPLWGIPPLDTTTGIRIHDAQKGRRWGMEFALRAVAAQNRLGYIHAGTDDMLVEDRTPGFTVFNIRAYYNYTKNLNFVAGIDNVFDRNYIEHLDLRLTGPTGYPGPATMVYRPGFSPYFGVNWTF